MARILFIVNEHLTEAFAIAVARETAKLLRAKGHTVLWRKFKPEDTVLGTIIKSAEGKKFSRKKLEEIYHKWSEKVVDAFISETKPDIAYNFHTSPKNAFWGDYSRGIEPADFIIEREKRFTPKLQTVEIKAIEKRLPKRTLDKVNKKAPKSWYLREYYLEKNASQRLTREKGLHPENFAKEIATIIENRQRKGLLTSGELFQEKPQKAGLKEGEGTEKIPFTESIMP
jgi:hypothetical protein